MVHFSMSENVCLDQKINGSRGFGLNTTFLKISKKCGIVRNDPSEKCCCCFSIIVLISIKSCWDFRLSSYPHRFQCHPNHGCCLLPSLYFFPENSHLTCDGLKMLIVCFLCRPEWCWDVATSGLGYSSCPLCALLKMWHGQRKSWTCLLWVLGIILHARVVYFILYQSEGGSPHWVMKISPLIICIAYPLGKQIKFRPQRCPVLKGSQYLVWFDWG